MLFRQRVRRPRARARRAWSPSASPTARSPTSPPRSPATDRHPAAPATLTPARRAGSRPPPNVGRAVAGGEVGDIDLAVRRRLDPARRCPASPRSSRSGSAPSRWPTARSARCSRPTSSTSPAARRSPTPLMVDARHRRGPAPRRTRSRTTPTTYPFTGARSPPTRVRPEARVRARPTTPPSQIVAVARRRPTRSTTSIVKIFDPDGELLVTGDLGTSPEAATYSADAIPAGVYSVQVCPFDAPDRAVPAAGRLRRSRSPTQRHRRRRGTGDLAAQPALALLHRQPDPRLPRTATPTNSVVGCWVSRRRGLHAARPARCATSPPPARGTSSTATGASTFTTVGNNANTHEAWASPLTPGGLVAGADLADPRVHRRVHRRLEQLQRCDPAELVPGRQRHQRVGHATCSSAHNRMHDYSLLPRLHRGELQHAARQPRPRRRRRRPGDRQRPGRRADRRPAVVPRPRQRQPDHAAGRRPRHHQPVPLPADRRRLLRPVHRRRPRHGHRRPRVHPRHQQPDGRRPRRGPHLRAGRRHGRVVERPGRRRVPCSATATPTAATSWAVGVYATGNKEVAIRDYAIDNNPLNYSDYGFDTTGDEVHADGEIWNGTLWEVRQALVDEVRRPVPVRRQARCQLRCAQATADGTPRCRPSACPGNRRWVQLMFDSFLLQQGATSMLDARDAMLAADRMRFGGAERRRSCGRPSPAAAWAAAPRRPTPTPATPTPSFATATGANGRVTFARQRPGQGLRRPLRGPRHPGRRHSTPTPGSRTRAGSRPARTEMLVRLAEARLQAVHARRSTAPGSADRDGSGDRSNLAASASGRLGHRRDRRDRSTPTSLHRRHRGAPTGAASTEGNVDDDAPVRSPSTSPAGASTVRPGPGQRRCSTRPRPTRATSRSRPTRTPTRARASPRCASSPSRRASASCDLGRRDVEAVLHLARPTRSRRVAPAPGRARPDAARVRACPTTKAAAVRLVDAGEPVHRLRRLRRRAGRRPDQRHRLRDGLRPRHDRARRRAAGLRWPTTATPAARLVELAPPAAPQLRPDGGRPCDAQPASTSWCRLDALMRGSRRALGGERRSACRCRTLPARSLGWRDGRTHPRHGRHARRRPRSTAGQGDRR